MLLKNIKNDNKKYLFLFLILWFFVQLSFLTQFPFMHSDESWLSNLSREIMIEDDFGVTESVFDLVPRFPHAIKVLFHVLQIGFIKIFDYQLFSVRLLSLICGVFTLYFFNQLILAVTESRTVAFLAMILLAVDVQFTYISHFARAEAVLMLLLIVTLWLVMLWRERHLLSHDVLIGGLLGLAIGVHPNAFFLALAIGFVYLWQMYQKKIRFINILILVFVVGIIATVFVRISYALDSNFFVHYFSYGSTLGVNETFKDKLFGLIPYFKRLFNQVSGTYYTPNVKLQLILFVEVVLVSLLLAFKKSSLKRVDLLCALGGIILGMVVVGRYSQPSVIFIFIISYSLLATIGKRSRFLWQFILIVSIVVIGNRTFKSVYPYLNDDYQSYLNKIKAYVPEDAIVLANLNAEYAFEAKHLFDYRNLAYLEENNITFSNYIELNNIEYIILPEEMEFIYLRRPVWNVMYGNLHPYYEDMIDFLDQKCVKVGEFNSIYAMRIVRFMNEENWSVQIFKVKMVN